MENSPQNIEMYEALVSRVLNPPISQQSDITVLIIVTGGTLSMINEGVEHSLKPSSVEDNLRNLRELKDSSTPRYDIIEWETLVDSSDMAHVEWCKLCRQIEENYLKYDGFVVIHGTDTMSYSASALSFMLENLSKPVVFTGSMLPLSHLRTDGGRNLAVSMMVAGYSRIAEVCVVFGSRLLRGNRSRKLDCSQMDAFHSPNYPPLGRIGLEIICKEQLFVHSSQKEFGVFTDICCNIVVLKMTVGLSVELLRQICSWEKRPFGIIIELYGSGTVSTTCGFVDAIREAIDNKIEVAAATQCVRGFCCLSLYENGAILRGLGVIECKDMTPEASFTKMSYLLGKGYSGEDLRSLMECDIRGELSLKAVMLPDMQSTAAYGAIVERTVSRTSISSQRSPIVPPSV